MPARRSRQTAVGAPGSFQSPPCGSVESKPIQQGEKRVWRLFFPARLGPPRKVKRMVAGVEVVARVRRMELPPSANERLHHQAKAKWVKAWREQSEQAWRVELGLGRIERLERVRISAVVYRRAIGTADEDNDRSRLKSLVDGMRAAGVIANDTRGHVAYGPCTEQRAGAEGPGILMIVEEVAGATASGEGGDDL